MRWGLSNGSRYRAAKISGSPGGMWAVGSREPPQLNWSEYPCPASRLRAICSDSTPTPLAKFRSAKIWYTRVATSTATKSARIPRRQGVPRWKASLIGRSGGGEQGGSQRHQKSAVRAHESPHSHDTSDSPLRTATSDSPILLGPPAACRLRLRSWHPQRRRIETRHADTSDGL